MKPPKLKAAVSRRPKAASAAPVRQVNAVRRPRRQMTAALARRRAVGNAQAAPFDGAEFLRVLRERNHTTNP